MSEPILILAGSGSGKTFSVRTMEPSTTMLISVDGKRPPFSMKEWSPFTKDNLAGSFYSPKRNNLYGSTRGAMAKAVENGKKSIIIDDSQFLMSNSFFSRAHEKGFDKFNELGQSFWMFLDYCRELPEDVLVYLMHHIDETETGHVKPKTLGKMLEDKGDIAGRFTVCIKAYRENGLGYFTTTQEGQDVFKSPPGMFDKDPMDNDLAQVDKCIREYWGI